MWTVAKKEWRDAMDRKAIMLFLILFVVAMPVGLGWFYRHGLHHWVLMLLPTSTGDHSLSVDNVGRGLLTGVLVIFPAFLPTNLAATAWSTETETQTLLPLLATPLTQSELFWGKWWGVFAPAFLVGGLAQAVFTIMTGSWPPLLFMIGVIGFLYGFYTIVLDLGLLISIHTKNIRQSYEIAALLTFPVTLVSSGIIPMTVGSLGTTGFGIVMVIFAGLAGLVTYWRSNRWWARSKLAERA